MAWAQPDVSFEPQEAFGAPRPSFMHSAAAYFQRLRAAVSGILVSALVLVPCFWQPSIHSADLASHLYNAWLYPAVKAGFLPGLFVSSVGTNVLFDWLLTSLWVIVGPMAAEKLAVGCSALLFFWGIFAFASKISGRRIWDVVPILWMLTYGLIFHYGFFNFYLSIGLSTLAGALLLSPGRLRLIAILLLTLSCLAHVLPVVWVLAVVAYLSIHRKLIEHRLALFVSTLFVVVITHGSLRLCGNLWTWETTSVAAMVGVLTGADQFASFGPRYLIVCLGFLFLWSIVVFPGSEHWEAWIRHAPVQLLLIHIAGAFLTPLAVDVGFTHPLGAMRERMSLLVAVCWLVLAGWRRLPKVVLVPAVGLLVVFAYFLYTDHSAGVQFEARIRAVVAKLPPNSAVVARFDDPQTRWPALGHVIDRACIGNCFSYGNYEPSMGHFRLGVRERNPFVMASRRAVEDLELGKFVVRSEDPTLFAVRAAEDGFGVSAFVLKPGDRVNIQSVRVYPDHW